MERPKIDKDPRKVLNFDDQGSNNNKSRGSKNASDVPEVVNTGAIQKKKSAFRSIKPSNSFKHSEGSHFSFSKIDSLTHKISLFHVVKKLHPIYSS